MRISTYVLGLLACFCAHALAGENPSTSKYPSSPKHSSSPKYPSSPKYSPGSSSPEYKPPTQWENGDNWESCQLLSTDHIPAWIQEKANKVDTDEFVSETAEKLQEKLIQILFKDGSYDGYKPCKEDESDAIKIFVKLFKVLKKGGKEEVYSFFSKIFDLAKEKNEYYYRDITKLIRLFVIFIEKDDSYKEDMFDFVAVLLKFLKKDETFQKHFFLLVRDLVGFVEQDDALQKNIFVLVKELIKFISKDEGLKRDIAEIIINFVGFIKKDYSFQTLAYGLVKDSYTYYNEHYKQEASYKQGVYGYLCSAYEYLTGAKSSYGEKTSYDNESSSEKGVCHRQGKAYESEEWAGCEGSYCSHKWCQCYNGKWTNCRDENPWDWNDEGEDETEDGYYDGYYDSYKPCKEEERDAFKIFVKLYKVLKKGGKDEAYSFFAKIFDLAKEKDYYHRDITKLIRLFVIFIEKDDSYKEDMHDFFAVLVKFLKKDEIFQKHFFLLVRDLVGFVEQDDAIQKNIFVLVKELIEFISKDEGFKEDIAAIIIKFVGFIEKDYSFQKLVYCLVKDIYAYYVEHYKQEASYKQGVYGYLCSLYEYLAGSKGYYPSSAEQANSGYPNNNAEQPNYDNFNSEYPNNAEQPNYNNNSEQPNSNSEYYPYNSAEQPNYNDNTEQPNYDDPNSYNNAEQPNYDNSNTNSDAKSS